MSAVFHPTCLTAWYLLLSNASSLAGVLAGVVRTSLSEEEDIPLLLLLRLLRLFLRCLWCRFERSEEEDDLRTCCRD